MPPPHEFSCWSGVIVAVLIHPTGVGPKNPGATDHWNRTIDAAVDFRAGAVASVLRPEEMSALSRLHPDGTSWFWGGNADDRAALTGLSEDDVVVLTVRGRVRAVGRVGLVTTNAALGDVLWPNRRPGKGSYLHVYSITRLTFCDLGLKPLRDVGINFFMSARRYDGATSDAVLAALGEVVPDAIRSAGVRNVGQPPARRPADEVRRPPGGATLELDAGDADPLSPGMSDLLARMEAMGSTDAPGAARAVRREQGLLRDALGIGSKAGDALVRCGLCGRYLPRTLLIAAHVKPRSECSEEERRDVPHVVMPACLLGCDALFEAGYVTVDERGRVLTARRALHSSPLQDVLRGLERKGAPAWSAEREGYFAWHREHRFRGELPVSART